MINDHDEVSFLKPYTQQSNLYGDEIKMSFSPNWLHGETEDSCSVLITHTHIWNY